MSLTKGMTQTIVQEVLGFGPVVFRCDLTFYPGAKAYIASVYMGEVKDGLRQFYLSCQERKELKVGVLLFRKKTAERLIPDARDAWGGLIEQSVLDLLNGIEVRPDEPSMEDLWGMLLEHCPGHDAFAEGYDYPEQATYAKAGTLRDMAVGGAIPEAFWPTEKAKTLSRLKHICLEHGKAVDAIVAWGRSRPDAWLKDCFEVYDSIPEDSPRKAAGARNLVEHIMSVGN